MVNFSVPIKYNISVYSKLWQAKERLLAFSLSSVILVTWRKFIVTSSIHMKNMVLFVLLSSVHFVKRTNIVFHLMWWKTLRTSPARVRIGNTNSVSVSKLTLQSYYLTCSTRELDNGIIASHRSRTQAGQQMNYHSCIAEIKSGYLRAFDDWFCFFTR